MTSAQTDTTGVLTSDRQCTNGYRTQVACWGWRSFGALIGLLGGIFAALIGSAFTATSWIVGVEGKGAYIHTLGTDFLLLTIPLLILGAHCLDAVEQREKVGKESTVNGNR